MKTETMMITTQATFSDDGMKRYILRKEWDIAKPSMAVIMLVPSDACGVSADTTSMLVLNNVWRLGYGSVTILNLFSVINDFGLKEGVEDDEENLNAIIFEVEKVDTVVYAPGVGKAQNKVFQQRQKQVLDALRPYEKKLHCLCNAEGDARLQHPLSPAVRTWYLSPLSISEFESEVAEQPQEKKPAKKQSKKK